MRVDEDAGVATLEPLAIPAPSRGIRIDVDRLSRRVRGANRAEITLLDDVSFMVAPGELVAIVGPSGAGKTTLLEAIAGVTPPTSGSVYLDGIDLHANLRGFRSVLGYVPQDDIVHADLPLERTLHYAARLRLPSSTTAADIDTAVTDALDAVGLTDYADVRVGALSGGQRKRATIALHLLPHPPLFFRAEPTSGLAPIISAELVARLRSLAGGGATVVFTTHSVADLAACDRIVFLTRGGRAGFVGTLQEALQTFGVGSVPELYCRLADADTRAQPSRTAMPRPSASRVASNRPVANGFTQWRVLSRRTFDTIVRNRLTLAILVGSPALVVGMFAILFRPGAFDVHHPSPSSMVMIGFWVVF